MIEKKVKIPSETSSYIEGLFVRFSYLKSLLLLLMSNEEAKEEDVEYYLDKTMKASIELEIAKYKLQKYYNPSNYEKFYMDFPNNQIIFYKKEN